MHEIQLNIDSKVKKFNYSSKIISSILNLID